MKNEKGITLIALVITVIIMLILAGVAISALTGDGGLFNKSRKSAEAYEDASNKEAKQISDLMNALDGYIDDLNSDNKAPSVAKLEVSNITETGFTLTATGKDNVGISKYEFYIKGENGEYTLEKTIESGDTTVTYEVTGKNLQQNLCIYKLKVYDKVGNSKESSELLVELPDTTAPTVATLAVSNITENGFTLTATAEDDKGIVKYEFYLKDSDGNFNLEKTKNTNGNTATYDVIKSISEMKSYVYKVKVYDAAGNSKESDAVIVGIKVGDYVNYDAGVWTQEDFNKIISSAGSPTVNGTTALPSTQGQFGGFIIGQSRNTNSTPYDTNYTPRTAGWRVWDINNETGVVTLINAGHSETYYHNNNSSASINILKNRDCTMYVNNYATEAHILTGQEAATWYNKQYGTNYSIIENEASNSTFYRKTFSTSEPISVLENGSYYWLASAYNSNYLYNVNPSRHYVGDNNSGFGVRVLVSLKSDILLESGTGDGSVSNPWKLVQN